MYVDAATSNSTTDLPSIVVAELELPGNINSSSCMLCARYSYTAICSPTICALAKREPVAYRPQIVFSHACFLTKQSPPCRLK